MKNEPFFGKMFLFFLKAFFALVLFWGFSQSAFAGNMDVWWPIDGAKVSGTQPFKVLISDRAVESYQMFWQVDNGQLVLMDNNYQDYPHKESQVDLSGWNWRGSGPYQINFVAKDWGGNVLGEKMVNVYVQSPTNSGGSGTIETGGSQGGGSLSGFKFYVNPDSNAKKQADLWRKTRPDDARHMDKLASQAESRWIGDWNSDIYLDVKNYTDLVTSSGSVPVFIAYNIPFRDCGSYSGGGAKSPDAYRAWIRSLAQGIGSNKAVIILEPDALANNDCLSWNDKQIRYDLLKDAVSVLKSYPQIRVYLDSGNPRWISDGEMVNRLKAANVVQADGFALNVSNFYTNQENADYGQRISSQIGGKHFVVDSSRNGLGSNGEWCNPGGRALGAPMSTNTGNSLIDAFLWVKAPGESDGWCNGGPSAGVWWPDYALGLAQRAAW